MEINISSFAKEILINKVKIYLSDFLEKRQWLKLFNNTGESIIKDPDKEKHFENDLSLAFSDEKLNEIALSIKDEAGFDLPVILRQQLSQLMEQYEIPAVESESYIRHFTESIIHHIEVSNSDKRLEIFLGNWRRDLSSTLNSINKKLDALQPYVKNNEKPITISIDDIEQEIKKSTQYEKLDLSFFELDDEQFEYKFNTYIKKKKERISIVGNNREETLYRVLNELKVKGHSEETLIIRNHDNWKKLVYSGCKNRILIVYFFADDIMIIPENINILIYNSETPCYDSQKIELRKRTWKSIISSLENLGINKQNAYDLVTQTHGLYTPLKKRVFQRIAESQKPDLATKRSNAVLAALLCGSWTDADGDREVFEHLSGIPYSSVREELHEYTLGENPLLLAYKNKGENTLCLSCPEDAWEEYDPYVSPELWNTFVSIVKDVLSTVEPLFERPLNEHPIEGLHVARPQYSRTLKHAMIQSCLMRIYYQSHTENQLQVNSTMKQILDTINDIKKWAYISQYVTDLCEVAPDIVLNKLESEITKSTGLLELFSSEDHSALLYTLHSHEFLWAIEQLLLQKRYVSRALSWLWQISQLNIDYHNNNSPERILKTVFCPWINTTALQAQEKIDNAKTAMKKYDNSWIIISSELPKNGVDTVASLSSPRHIQLEDAPEITNEEIYRTYLEYLSLCIENAGTDPKRWIKILDELTYYDFEKQKEILSKIPTLANQMDDSSIIQIKDAIRKIIHDHRYFKDSDWCMTEEEIKGYEELLKQINTKIPEYEYRYLFSPDHDFPLLHPFPYDKEKDISQSKTNNEKKIEEERENRIKDFKSQGLSLKKLLSILNEDYRYEVGKIIARHYCNGKYNDNVFSLLIETNPDSNFAYNYARELQNSGNLNMQKVVQRAKENGAPLHVICDLISLQIVGKETNAIICSEDETIKKFFWEHNQPVFASDIDASIIVKALNACSEYGNKRTYIDLLFKNKEFLSIEQLYESFIKIEKVKGIGTDSPNSLMNYYIEKLLEILYKNYKNKSAISEKLAIIEWQFHSLLGWNKMKFFQDQIKFSPKLYAKIINIIYKKENETNSSEEARNAASELFPFYYEVHFCPTEKDGTIDYDNLKDWLEDYRKELIKQNQENLWERTVGKLLAYSPIGDDGYMPCEAVRNIIEEYNSSAIKSAYELAERNKRVASFVDDGKSELMIAERYKSNAEALQARYPHTAEIYFNLSNTYMRYSKDERERAENE